jgi:plasmid maintenance system killer protein
MINGFFSFVKFKTKNLHKFRRNNSEQEESSSLNAKLHERMYLISKKNHE